MNWKPIAVFVAGTALGALLLGHAPLGQLLWPPADGPDPAGANMALLMVMGVLEALAFGLGITFLAYGRRHVQSLTRSRDAYATVVWLAIAWLLVNWVPHTSLHMAHGNILAPADYTGLVGIEYGFHLTVMLAGALLVHACYRASRAGVPAATATKATAAVRAR